MNEFLETKEYRNRIWYLKTYEKLIIKSLTRGLDKTNLPFYTEIHHIVPKCCGGTNNVKNLCLLSAREHVIAHMLLSCMYPDNFNLALAVSRMFVIKEPSIDNKDYTTIKSRYDVTTRISTRLISHFREKSIEAIRIANTGRKKSEETLRKLGESVRKFNREHPNYQKGKKVHTEQHKKELSERWKGENNPNYGGMTEEHKRNLSISHMGISPNQKKVLDSNTGKIYRSISDACRNLKIKESTFKYWLKNKPNKGYKIL